MFFPQHGVKIASFITTVSLQMNHLSWWRLFSRFNINPIKRKNPSITAATNLPTSCSGEVA
jgi:hypothetical protein